MVTTIRRLWNAASAALEAAGALEGATPHEVVWRSGPVRLRAYRPATVAPGATPLVLVTPLINRFRVVDLDAGSLVATLLDRGLPVYVVDWGDPRRIDAGIDLADCALRLLPRALDAIGASEGVDLAGYCLGGTIAVLGAACWPARVRRLVTINAPVDFSCDDEHMDLLKLWVEREHFPVEALTAAHGNMPGALILQGFSWQKPLASALKLPRAWGRMEDRAFARGFARLEAWNDDSVDVPGAAYRTLIQALYRENRLARGTLELRGRRVDLARISCPLLVVTASKDTTCPPAAARALLDLVGTPAAERAELRLEGGHVAPVVGKRAAQHLHHPLADWLLA